MTAKISKLPKPEVIGQEIADGMTMSQIMEKYGMSEYGLRNFRNRFGLPRPLIKPAPRREIFHSRPLAEFVAPPRRYQGPVDDARRVVVNGISVPRIVSIHGEFRG